jgi:hypothetical protein
MSYDYAGVDKYRLAITLPDDSSQPNKANYSPGWEGNRDACVNLSARQLGKAGAFRVEYLNWTLALSGNNPSCPPVWDVAHARWFIAELTTKKIYVSYEGVKWSAFATLSHGPVTALATNPTTGQIVGVLPSSGTTAGLNVTNDIFTETTSPTLDASGGIEVIDYFIAISRYVLVQGRPSTTAYCYTSANGTTWSSDLGSSLPSGFGHDGATPLRILTAQSAMRMLFVEAAKPGATTYTRTDDGSTFTTATLPSMTGSEFVSGLTYDKFAQRFILQITGLFAPSRLMVSPTGATGSWTLLRPSPIATQGIVAVDGHGVTLLASIFFTYAGPRIGISVDGGVTFTPASAGIANFSTWGPLYAGSGQFLFAPNDTYFAISGACCGGPTLTVDAH